MTSKKYSGTRDEAQARLNNLTPAQQNELLAADFESKLYVSDGGARWGGYGPVKQALVSAGLSYII